MENTVNSQKITVANGNSNGYNNRREIVKSNGKPRFIEFSSTEVQFLRKNNNFSSLPR